MLRDLVIRNRSYRRFYQEVTITSETLRELIDLARLSPSAANKQALKYIISNDPEKNALIFPHIHIDNDPADGERPSAYIVILEDTAYSRANRPAFRSKPATLTEQSRPPFRSKSATP